jgi:hypothetical protein
VESFHARLREECLRVSWFSNLFDMRRKIADWKVEYNEQRPHSSLGYRTPAEFAQVAITRSYGKDVGFAHLENARGVSHFATAPAATGFIWHDPYAELGGRSTGDIGRCGNESGFHLLHGACVGRDPVYQALYPFAGKEPSIRPFYCFAWKLRKKKDVLTCGPLLVNLLVHKAC